MSFEAAFKQAGIPKKDFRRIIEREIGNGEHEYEEDRDNEIDRETGR